MAATSLKGTREDDSMARRDDVQVRMGRKTAELADQVGSHERKIVPALLDEILVPILEARLKEHARRILETDKGPKKGGK
jgi:hypothetical protein